MIVKSVFRGRLVHLIVLALLLAEARQSSCCLQSLLFFPMQHGIACGSALFFLCGWYLHCTSLSLVMLSFPTLWLVPALLLVLKMFALAWGKLCERVLLTILPSVLARKHLLVPSVIARRVSNGSRP